MIQRTIPVFVAAVAGWSLLFPPNAHAYLDPGTGSFIFQLLAGAVLGGLVTIKMYWYRIRDFFTGQSRTDDEAAKDSTAGAE